MNQNMQINGQSLPVQEIKGQRVVSTKQVAELHKVPFINVQNNFKNNKKHLIEGEDYFKVLEKNPERQNLLVSRIYLTETGYLLLSKSFKDDLSWQIMKHLVACYFKVAKKEIASFTLTPTMQNIVYYRQLGLTQSETSKLLDISKRSLQAYEQIMKEMGIELPHQDPLRKQKALANG